MSLTPITVDTADYPAEMRSLMDDAAIYDSSCSPNARVLFIDKDCGYYLKSAPKNTLEREAVMTRYFHTKGLAARVAEYVSDVERDYLLTEKVPGDDCRETKYLEHPERLAELLGERLALLHSLDCTDCPVLNNTERCLAVAESNYRAGTYDKSLFPDNWGYTSAEEAWRVIEERGRLLKTDTLLHGDYCLPNIILNDWQFSGFIDLGGGGTGDRHVDIFWGVWSLMYNLKTDKHRDRFLDAYGREKIDEDMLRVIAACEVFDWRD
ncbi:aminoglycoside phosphotransferase APH(3') [Clostridia bacterium]|nr:aminoglycoside phosphotransferase APH(3') [Clostridia bacterium]